MSDENLDIINEHNQVVGCAAKSAVHEQGIRHRVGAVILQREDGKYLIPTASAIKVESGRLYHSAAGHVVAGESYTDAAKRELEEETGVAAQDIEYLGTFWFERDYPGRKERELFEVYRSRYRQGMGPVRLNEEQVNELWLSEDELKTLFNQEPERLSAPLAMTCRLILGFEDAPANPIDSRFHKEANRKLTIYFGCAMLGGYPHVSRETLAQFPAIIRSLGHTLASDHQTRPGIIEAESTLHPAYIHDRDYEWLTGSDAGIFEISNPSLGVGAEISDMLHLGKPVLLLYQKGLEAQVSAYTRGKAGSSYVKGLAVCRAYRDMAEGKAAIAEFIEARAATARR